jgi:glycosyltransferase involved in cell wall biosynthesis
VKLLYIVTAYPRSEADIITPWLLETIERLRERQVEVEVLAPSYRGLGDQVIRGTRVHRFRYAPRGLETLTHDRTAPDRIRENPLYASLLPGYLLAGSRAAARLARSGEFDAVHAFWPLPHGLLGLAAKRATGIPLVSTFFGVELTWVESQLRPLRPLVRRIAMRSDAVTAISTHTSDLLRRIAPEVEPVIVPFGAAVDASDGSPEPDARLHSGLRVLFVGRLVERKGVHVLLDALALLPEEPPIVLEVVGDGPEREKLEHRARSLGVTDRVRFHGFLPRSELERHLGECDALVLPAVVDAKGDVEGLGVVLLEAMSFGKPVIASAAGGIVDIVKTSENGLLVPPGDAPALAAAIECLARDPELVRRLGGRAIQDVRANFSWSSILDRLESVYRRVTRPVSSI